MTCFPLEVRAMLPTRIIIVPIWGTSIPNMSHVNMRVPYLICHSLMMSIVYLPQSLLLSKEGHFSC